MSIERLRDFDYLLSNFYTVDSSTMIGPEQLNADDLLGESMKINKKEDGPKVIDISYSFTGGICRFNSGRSCHKYYRNRGISDRAFK